MPKELDQDYLATLDEAFGLLADGHLSEASDACTRARDLNPNGVEWLYIMGLIGLMTHETGHAIEIFLGGHQQFPKYQEFPEALSAMYAQIGKLADSSYYAKVALTLEECPELKKFRQGDYANFQTNMRRTDISEHYVSAVGHLKDGKYKEAIQACESELRVNPDHQDCLELYSRALSEGLEFDKAIEVSIQCAQTNPDEIQNWLNLGGALRKSGRAEEAMSIFQNALEQHPGSIELGIEIGVTMAYLDEDTWSGYAEYDRGMAELLEQNIDRSTTPSVSPFEDLKGSDPVLVGFLLNENSISQQGEVLANLFPLLDPEHFKIFIYQQYSQYFHVTQRLKNMVYHWRPVSDIDDEALELIIKNDGVHHLVDLCGLLPGGRLPLLHRKPAPHHISWLGFPLDSLPSNSDVIFSCDDTIDVDERDSGGVRCVSLGPTLFPYPGGSVEMVALNDQCPVHSNNFITFGAFLDMSKFTASIVLWCEVLKSVKGSKLLLGGGRDLENIWPLITPIINDLGIADRVSLQNEEDVLSERASLLSAVDIILDTTPISGVGEICDALWMGVPVVTLKGNSRFSRIGASLLNAAGFSDWVAGSQTTYVEKAVKLASDLDALGTLRTSMRATMEQSELMDAKSFAKRLERIFKDLLDDGASKTL